MKKNKLFMMAAALTAALCLGSCSNEADELTLPAEGSRMVKLTITLPGGEADTRTGYAVDETTGNLKVTWEKRDELTAFAEDVSKRTTFKLESGAGTATATFTGELPADVTDGDYVRFYYPTLKEVDGKLVYLDLRSQTGQLDDLSSVDVISASARYTETDGLTIVDIGHAVSLLRLTTGLQVLASGSGNATLTLSNTTISVVSVGKNYEESPDDIVVSDVPVLDGKLTSDVYIAFANPIDIPVLGVTCGSETMYYSLNRADGFGRGAMYTLSDITKLTALDIAPISAPAVGLVIGADGKYYLNAFCAKKAGTTAEAMIAYLGTGAGSTTGLAISLEDVLDDEHMGVYAPLGYKWEEVESAVTTWTANHTVSGGTWRLPSVSDWMYMFEACGGDTHKEISSNEFSFSPGDFRDKVLAVGGSGAYVQDAYWSSTSGTGDKLYTYVFRYSNFQLYDKTSQLPIRPVLAF